ncbi:MAG TPA: hypothetical protein VF792_09065 [Ktedonobacterales bacterium]
MAQIEQRGAGSKKGKMKPVVFHPKKRKKTKAKNGRKTSTHATHAGANSFHEAAGAGSVGNAHAGSLPLSGAGSSAGAASRTVVELTGLNAATPEGLSGAILDLVGEGQLSVAHALAPGRRILHVVRHRRRAAPRRQQRLIAASVLLATPNHNVSTEIDMRALCYTSCRCGGELSPSAHSTGASSLP